jgi:prolyl oligopeptidase
MSKKRAQETSSTALKRPPVAPVKPVVDDYHDTKVSDPYRYMENLDDPAVQSWFKAQDDFTRSVLARIPGREHLLQRIEVLDESVPQVGVRRLPGNIYDIVKRLPGDDVFKLYRRAGMTGPDTLLVDPERVKLAPSSQNKGKNAISGGATSGDSRYAAVVIAPGGSELDQELHVFETATGRETGDVITRAGVEGLQPSWLPDNRSFVYGRLQDLPAGAPAAEVRQKFRSYLHVLGTDPAKDVPVFGYGVVPSINVDPSLIASVEIQFDSRYALGVLNGSVTPNSAYYIAPVSAIGKSNREWRKVADLADGVTSIAIHNDDLYLLTYKGAPRFKVLRIDAHNPDISSAETVVPPSEAVITAVRPAKDGLYVQLLDGGIGRLLRVPYGSKAKVETVPLPFQGSVFIDTDPRLEGALIFGSSWTRAYKVYSYDPATKQVIDTGIQPRGPYDRPDNLESVEVKATAADGTLIPLSIVYRKGVKMDGSNPVLLDGYGGYGVSIEPYFEPASLAWFEKGGILAFCHARGGGEYGEEWHLAGKGPTKPNTWRDFIACGRYLIDHKYTSPAHLAGKGTSAGGILIGRAITERPDLFAAAIDNVGVSDTLRFENTQNGETNIPELGTVKTEEGFKSLYAMSAYAHIEDGTRYPAVLFETGMNDPRVDPWQMAKMAARTQAATTSGKPVLLRVEFAGGHGGMGGTQKHRREVMADEWSFLLWQLGVPEFQPAH